MLERVKARLPSITRSIAEGTGCAREFTVKVKPFPGNRQHDMAMYRSMTQFKGKPIFWINEQLPSMAKKRGVESSMGEIIDDTLYHEYGHLVAEWARKRDPATSAFIASKFTGEEEFAEKFVTFITRGYNKDAFAPVTKAFCDDLDRAFHPIRG